MDLVPFLKGAVFGLGIGPLHESDARFETLHRLEIDRRPAQIDLDSDPEVVEVGVEKPKDVQGVGYVAGLLHVDLDARSDGLCFRRQPAQVVDARTLVEGEAELRELYRYRRVDAG